MQFPDKNGRRYYAYPMYAKQKFNERLQKISINAGFTCPNRDGTKATGGCTYCDNSAFSPFYCRPEKSVEQQIAEGIAFFEPKYKTQRYFAYFQAFSNTYAPLPYLKQLYEQALAHPKIVGLIVATRPDCIDNEKLAYLSELAARYYVMIEYGVESTLNSTLQRINRHHTFEEAQAAIKQTAAYGIEAGAHLILGLPGENREQLLEHAHRLSELPITTLKLHQLQVLQGRAIARDLKENPADFIHFSAEEYIELVVDFLERLSPCIVVERFISESPPGMVLFPRWNRIKNFEIVHRIEKRLKERQTVQGQQWRES